MDFTNAVIYDIEVFPNVFTLHAELLTSETSATWEISQFVDQRQALLQWFTWLNRTQTPMIGFNNEAYDYTVIHAIMKNPQITPFEIYEASMRVINSKNRFENMVWQDQRFAPQVDLFKIHHFDNVAKSTSLKALEIAMRSHDVVDVIGTKIPLGQPLTKEQIDGVLIPYNKHDVKETKRFAIYSKPAIDFRVQMLGKIPGDVLNFNDTKIGAKILEERLGEAVCYARNGFKKTPRQTVRHAIPLNDIIFPYIHFENPEFNRVLEWMRTQTLTSDDIENPEATIKTKGAFKGVSATVGGMEFKFGTGGIHGSVSAQKVFATEETAIEDIDVKSLYPSIAIVNRLFPEHLGEAFVQEYARLPQERGEWQKKKGKKCVEANSMKLAANGTYGNSNSQYSVFYDPKFTMTITINGQLMLCMLAEKLLQVPSLQFIQINTDGITYKIKRSEQHLANVICQNWEKVTALQLESAHYSKMFIRDVNNYIAVDEQQKGDNKPPSIKQKGAYWHPDSLDYAASISNAGPPAWHKDFNPVVVTKAAVMAMLYDLPVDGLIRSNSDPFDFMCRAKVNRASKLFHGSERIQGVSRYYVSQNGRHLKKISEPTKGNEIGQFKRKNGITDATYRTILAEIGAGVWDERIHTKNRSKYEMREMSICAGQPVSICNTASDFSFDNVNYEWYIKEANKLIIK